MVRHMPLINGVEYSWSSITVNIAGLPETGIVAIEFGDKQDMENIYGAGQNPIARGYGRITPSASITLLKSAVESIRAASTTGRLQDIAPFDIVVICANQGNPKAIKHVIKNCQFTEDTFSGKSDDLKFEIVLPLIVSEIIWNA